MGKKVCHECSHVCVCIHWETITDAFYEVHRDPINKDMRKASTEITAILAKSCPHYMEKNNG